jgi:formylglycine-generating enzyme required for sulfatase activity
MDHEVTQAEWQQVMGGNPSAFKACGPTCPVEQVSWNDAQAFATLVSARDGVTYRLPTEAEWEWAARGGSSHPFAGAADPEAVAWFGATSQGTSGPSTNPVCQRRRNAYGLCDMSGNVFEWVADRYGPYAEGTLTDPVGVDAGSKRVLRGGGWSIGSQGVRVSYRHKNEQDYRYNHIGFRLVRSAP